MNNKLSRQEEASVKRKEDLQAYYVNNQKNAGLFLYPSVAEEYQAPKSRGPSPDKTFLWECYLFQRVVSQVSRHRQFLEIEGRRSLLARHQRRARPRLRLRRFLLTSRRQQKVFRAALSSWRRLPQGSDRQL